MSCKLHNIPQLSNVAAVEESEIVNFFCEQRILIKNRLWKQLIWFLTRFSNVRNAKVFLIENVESWDVKI